MQAQAQSDQQMQDAKIQAMAARAGVDAAKQAETFAATQERYAKTQDLQASAEHKTMQSDLELVKMMVELEDMQFTQFHNAFERSLAVKQANQITETATATGGQNEKKSCSRVSQITSPPPWCRNEIF